MTVTVERETDKKLDFNEEEVIREVVRGALAAEQCPYDAEVDVLLTDDAAIRTINKNERGIDSATDVISFPFVEYPSPGDFSQLEDDPTLFHPESGELMLGDMVISLEKVCRQAAEYGHSEKRELAFLTAHSMFHLMGYDHEDEEGRLAMEAKQEALLQSLGITRDEYGRQQK